MEFIGRRRELKILADFLKTPQAGLLILYGRRRVGKTSLISHFIEQQPESSVFYWVATTHNEAFQLRDFSQAILRHDPHIAEPPSLDYAFPGWEAALNHLANLAETHDRPYIIVLDEFTYLLRNETAISSIFQKVWDQRLSRIPQIRLVLTGSLLGMMAREVFSYQAPLYGRATAQIRLRPLPFGAFSELFPDRSAAERVAIYGVTGGVPAYIDLFTRTGDFVSALRDHGLAPSSMLLSDPAVILYEQIQEPQAYEAILSAIAAGFHQWSDIAKMAGISETALGYYLKSLQELEFVERQLPILAKPGAKSGRYHLQDHFLRFYYRFIVPQLGAIGRGYQQAAADKINAELRPYLGLRVFEDLCREWVWAAAIQGQLAFVPELVGSYWRGRGSAVQLDVVAAAPREKRLLIGEAKWGRGKLERRLLNDLVARSQRMPQVAAGWQTEYVLFAREGFTPAMQAEAAVQGARLISLTALEQTLISTER